MNMRPLRRQVPYVPQAELTDCGAACLAMVLAFHGHHAPLGEVRERCGSARDGATALKLVRAARTYGLDARGERLGPAELRSVRPPAILHWEFNHFVVLERASARRYVLVDPLFGRVEVTERELRRRYTGVALVFDAPRGFARRRRAHPSLDRYLRVFRSQRGAVVQILLAAVGLQVVALAVPVATQVLIDRVVIAQQHGWLWGLAAGLTGTWLAKSLLVVTRNWVTQGLATRLDAELMAEFVAHLVRLPLTFFAVRAPGDLAHRVQSNGRVRSLLQTHGVGTLLDVVLVLAYGGLMLAYDVALGALVVGLGAGRLLLLLALRRRTVLAAVTELAAAGSENASLFEALSGFETMKASRAEAPTVLRWSHRLMRYVEAEKERRRHDIRVREAMALVHGVTTAAVVLVGGQRVIANEMSVGVFASFLTLQSLFTFPLESLLTAISQLQYMASHLARIDDVMRSPIERQGGADPGPLGGALEVRDVSFAYDAGARPVITGLSFAARAGEKIAIVGRTGAGKSTLAGILLGTNVPSAGSVLLDGRPLAELELGRVRRQIGVVLQHDFLLDDTVRANLSLHDPAIPLERLRWAAEMACVHDVIEALPQGYDTRVGERGSLLSGGQRQRMVLARALVHQPPILLLDEATSAVDADLERRIHANLAALRCTRIVIAHRLATVTDADRVLVLAEGRIVEEGTYDELSLHDTRFRAMLRAKELALA